MRKFAVLGVATLMAITAAIADSRPAAAGGRDGAVVAGIIGGIALGAILSHKHRRHSYSTYYRYDRPYYYSGGYYRPYSYAPRRYYAPRKTYRVYRYKKHRRYH